MKVTQLCPSLCHPMDYTDWRILQARLLEWVAIPFSRGSSPPRDQTHRPHCRRILYQLSHRGMLVAVNGYVVPDSVTPWTKAHQSPLYMEFSRQEYWIGWPFPSPRNLSLMRVFFISGRLFTVWGTRGRVFYSDMISYYMLTPCLKEQSLSYL